MNDPKIVSVTPDHPGQGERQRGAESTVLVLVDTGLKSGRLTAVTLTEGEAIAMAASFAVAAAQAFRGNR